jgi:4-hydroxy-3-methylbut-2-enyl diphosphate reductase
MHVIRARALGMCFGVRDALAVTAQVAQPTQVTIHGELVHNAQVNRRLAARGFASSGEAGRGGLPATPAVLITAHGVSDAERARLVAAGKMILDTTCPLVRRAHRAARALADEGRHVLVIGQRGHVEVLGITGDLPSYTVIEAVCEVTRYEHVRIGVVCQTTTLAASAARLVAAIRAANPQADIRVVDTICRPTKDRQDAVADLLRQVDAMVVVGGHASNNTQQLVARCRAAGVRTWHVEDPRELRGAWLVGVRRVGLTAGTSTLPETVEAVEARLRTLAHAARTAQRQGEAAWPGSGMPPGHTAA